MTSEPFYQEDPLVQSTAAEPVMTVGDVEDATLPTAHSPGIRRLSRNVTDLNGSDITNHRRREVSPVGEAHLKGSPECCAHNDLNTEEKPSTNCETKLEETIATDSLSQFCRFRLPKFHSRRQLSVSAGPVHRVGCEDETPCDCRVTRIVHISDTHGSHNGISIPDGDVLIHSGDFFTWDEMRGFEKDVADVDKFFAKQPHKHKIFVAGNHEMTFEERSANEIQSRLSHVTYLQDSCVDVDGLIIYGSPWTFARGTPATAYTVGHWQLEEECWDKIPDKVDILVTHCPPKDILDFDGRCGCPRLREHIFTRIRPKVHLFGHAHHIAQVVVEGGILFSNGTQGERCFGRSKPAVIDVHYPYT